MNHKHRTRATSAPSCWTGCVSECCGCDAAHGGVVYRQTCKCGASRLVEANGLHRAYGPWVEPVKPVRIDSFRAKVFV